MQNQIDSNSNSQQLWVVCDPDPGQLTTNPKEWKKVKKA